MLTKCLSEPSVVRCSYLCVDLGLSGVPVRYNADQWRLLEPDVTSFDDPAKVDATLDAGSFNRSLFYLTCDVFFFFNETMATSREVSVYAP